MLRAVFIILFCANVFLLVSSGGDFEESREEHVQAQSSAQSSVQSSRSSSSKSNGHSSTSSSSRSSSSQASSSSNSTVVIKTKCSKCKKNERWVECPPILCVPFTCDDLGRSISCPRIDPANCPKKPACVCIEGYVRNKKGICVPKNQCPSCGGDPNAGPGCGFLCGPSCTRKNIPPVPCPCVFNGCQCKAGYIYDDNLRKCVCPSKCTKACPQNEVYNTCANGGCGKWNCTQIDQPTLCIDPIKCIGGCNCKKGYLRSKKGICIPQEDCRKDLCPKPNQVYDPCPLACPPRKCGTDDRAVLCLADQPCLPADCRCKDGTYRNNKDECVPWEECPPTTEPPTEECPTEAPVTVPPGQCPEDAEQTLINANAAFGGLFLYEAMKSKPGENVICSAFSVLTPISQLAYFSQGNTLAQFLKVLGISSKYDIRCALPALLRKLSGDANVVLNLAVRIFATAKYPLTKEFIDYSEDLFNAGAENLDFGNPEAAAKRINEWAANATNNRINKIAQPSAFNDLTRLVLCNAMYFLGNWERPFDLKLTEDRDFYATKDNPVKIPTMYQQGSFKYGESSELNSKIIQIFYKGGNYSFVILLPNEIDGLSSVVEKVRDPKAFYAAFDNIGYQKVQLYLPRILIESSFDLSPIMQEAGMTDVFSPGKSNLTGILQEYQPLYISSGQQKAFIQVNENGTEAAVVNVITVGTTSVEVPQKIYEFICDHPFLYYILYDRIPIFSGLYEKPNNPSSN